MNPLSIPATQRALLLAPIVVLQALGFLAASALYPNASGEAYVTLPFGLADQSQFLGIMLPTASIYPMCIILLPLMAMGLAGMIGWDVFEARIISSSDHPDAEHHWRSLYMLRDVSAVMCAIAFGLEVIFLGMASGCLWAVALAGIALLAVCRRYRFGFRHALGIVGIFVAIFGVLAQVLRQL